MAAITTRDQLVAALATAQTVKIARLTSRVATAARYSQTFDLNGQPGAGTLAGANTVNGVVQLHNTPNGYPVLRGPIAPDFSALLKATLRCTVAGSFKLVDVLWKAGAYAFNASQTLSAQPSYSARIPAGFIGPVWAGAALWFECVTAFTGIPTITVTYTNQDGVAGKTTGAFSLGVAPIIGQVFQLPLAVGDSGVQKVETITATVATVGTFNILVCRDLWEGRIAIANDCVVHSPDATGIAPIFDSTAFSVFYAPDSTSTGVIDCTLKVGG